MTAILFPQTEAEALAGITPPNLACPPGHTLRYGIDPSGTADSTAAIQMWVDAAWAMYQFTDAQGLWDGAPGPFPVLILPPGKYKISGTIFLPNGITFRGSGHPAHTINHTRIIMNSTGTTPARTWSAATQIIYFDQICPSGASGYYFRATSGSAGGSAGTTGSAQPAWNTSTGASTTDGTVTWTCEGAVSTGDNRNVPMLKFQRGSKPGVGQGALTNTAVTSTIQELEFWYVTMGNNFSNPLSGNGIAWGDYPLGGVLAFDVDCADFYVVDCVFQNNPCSFWCSGIQNTSKTRGDGFTGNRGIGIFFVNCEFDAAAAHVWAQNSFLNLWFKHCHFFNAGHYYQGCSGQVIYENCYFESGAFVDAVTTATTPAAVNNTFAAFQILGGYLEQAPLPGYQAVPAQLNIYAGGGVVDVKGLTCVGASNFSCIRVDYATGGAVSNNTLLNAGYNDGVGNSAAINLLDCVAISISGNNISTPTAGTYAGSGIRTASSGRTSQYNFISNNLVGGSYAHYLNIAPGDVVGINYLPADTYVQVGVLSATGAVGVNGAIPPSQISGWGTPTGGSIQSNFSGSSATLAQTSAAVAEIIAALKGFGLFGS